MYICNIYFLHIFKLFYFGKYIMYVYIDNINNISYFC